MISGKSFFGKALPFALVFGEHNTTKRQGSISTGTERMGKRGRRDRGKKKKKSEGGRKGRREEPKEGKQEGGKEGRKEGRKGGQRGQSRERSLCAGFGRPEECPACSP